MVTPTRLRAARGTRFDMPKARSYREIIEKGLSRLQFILEQEEKAPRRLPRRVGEKPKAGTLFAQRNRRLALREAALRRVQVVLTYRKISTGEVRKYTVCPYEWKFLRSREGLRKVLYAYDMQDRHIKSFIQRNILKVALTDRKFRPMWPVRIG